jgi:hypothetical protein
MLELRWLRPVSWRADESSALRWDGDESSPLHRTQKLRATLRFILELALALGAGTSLAATRFMEGRRVVGFEVGWRRLVATPEAARVLPEPAEAGTTVRRGADPGAEEVRRLSCKRDGVNTP